MHDDYKDIIDKKYQKSKQFPPMPREKRAAQFAPFSVLNGFSKAILKTQKDMEKALENSKYQEES
ncbi:hypothetical protein CD56_06530 [Campylobacter lari]|uniref:Uncharacterized protein n=1 Tax=Campylobacter lari TaxID=201 RepID=A0A7U8BHB5_CAMLA|nr:MULTISPECIES: hypothetical protein [Campylobacter]AKJ53980.1 hypothetical protein CD56_06530 [Campylobacter lari]EAH6869019.1 hypothetical protein [Campylobacter lari]EAI5467058.1 hypothetical protein [Campylobacter lari]EAJ5681820.1 hypothetical protein [Campylobacter lari]EAK9856935.1 hypothetical protein [Campylobacter lari]